MFYDRNHPELPNWWDCLDQDSDESHREPDLGEPDSEKTTIGSLEEKPAHPDSRERFASQEDSSGRIGEDSAPIYRVRGASDEDELVTERVFSSLGRGYDLEVVESVWTFAEIVRGNDPNLWRKDEFGNWIHRLDYGRRDSEFGWEIFDPGVGRHTQGVYAMRPMQWESYLRQHEVFR